jgi:magnesium transporter
MLSAFVLRKEGLARLEAPSDDALEAALWIDLVDPTAEEEKRVEALLKIDIPTREEMREIEASNRFYEDNGALFLTATLVTKLDTDLPESTQVTFIFAGGKLVTNRYTDPLPFRRYITYAQTHPATCGSSVSILVGLLESIVNRIADVLERVGSELDSISAEVFAVQRHKRRRATRDFRLVLARVGQNGELVSKARESLVSLGRLLVFVQQSANGQIPQEGRSRFRNVSRDLVALSDHASYLGDKVSFSLEATLGMVSIDQNNILKIFSLITVFLLPPTVIGAFYGMNFANIPWLRESWGWEVALVMMGISAVLPYFIFKRRGWL